MQLSVVILNYNVRYFLELCVKSVLASISDLDAEIIVVDNNSTDGSCEMLSEIFKDTVKVIKNSENIGFSKAYNQAVNSCLGEYVCILNPDTIVAEDTFKKALITMKDSAIGAMGCRMIDGTGQFLPESKRNIPSPIVALKKILGKTTSYYSSLQENQNGYVDILAGAFIIVPKNLYKQVGGFDEDYFMYGEDIDFSMKILKKGFKNFYNADITIVHFKGESTMKNKSYAKRFYGAMYLFYKKHYTKSFVWGGFVYLLINILKLKYLFVNDNDSSKFLYKKETSKVLSADKLNYKSIISKLDDLKENFFIQPNESDYAIGSWGAERKGKMIRL